MTINRDNYWINSTIECSKYGWKLSVLREENDSYAMPLLCKSNEDLISDHDIWITETLYPLLKQFVNDPLEDSQSEDLKKQLKLLLVIQEEEAIEFYEEMSSLYGLLYLAKEKKML